MNAMVKLLPRFIYFIEETYETKGKLCELIIMDTLLKNATQKQPTEVLYRKVFLKIFAVFT